MAPAVAVAVLSPPSTVTVPITTISVPLGAKLNTSPPTVTRPPAVSVCPAITKLVSALSGDKPVVLVTHVGTALTITALPVGESEMTCPETVMADPGARV